MPEQTIEFEGTTHYFPDDFTAADISKALAKSHPAPGPAKDTKRQSMSGPRGNPNPGWGERFSEGATQGLLGNPGGIQSILHPIDTIMGMPGMLKDLATGNPETWGAAASGAPYMLMGGGLRLPEGTGAVMKGAGRGAWEGATAPSTFRLKGIPIELPVPASLSAGGVGYEVGSHLPFLGGPLAAGIGAGVGAAIPAVKGAIKGGVEAYRNRPQPPAPLELTPPPSGPAPRQTSMFPTGVDVHGLDMDPFETPGFRTTGSPAPIKPIHPATVDVSQGIPDLQPAAMPSTSPVSNGPITGLHLPEVPHHYAGEPNPVAAFKSDQAVVAELRKIPDITKQTLTPEMVQEVRKAQKKRPLADKDVERRIGHIRMMLPD